MFLRLVLPLICSVAAFLYLLLKLIKFSRVVNRRPWQWLRARRGWGMHLQEWARRLDLEVEQLRGIEPSYKETFIRKKRGGMRRLLIPDGNLKTVQRRILRRLLRRLRAHPAAMGFERGRSIVHNALPHTRRKVIIKLDLIDFFPSTPAWRVEAYFRRVGWNAEAAALLTRLCTHEGGLPQGAPTSPRLSNLVLWLLDARIARFVARRKGSYTRYADDITISFPKDYPRRIRGTIQKVGRLARGFGYKIHRRGKLRILRRHQQQRVTGLVVNDKVQLPRKLRRLLRAVEHRLRTGRAATLTAEQIQGWRALQDMIRNQTPGS